MNRLKLATQLAALENAVEWLPKPQLNDDPLAWLGWLDADEMMFVEGVIRRGVEEDIEPTAEERLRMVELQARCLREMIRAEESGALKRCAEWIRG